ncbi:MAG: hypothetical protein AAB295_11185 [Chloroflexota bacterium]
MRVHLCVGRRRKWAVVAGLLSAPAGALVLTSLQDPRYEASALVLMSRQSLAASLTGTPDVLASQDAVRYTQTQARLALIPAVASRVGTAADSDAEETYGYGHDNAYGWYDSPTTTEDRAARAPAP